MKHNHNSNLAVLEPQLLKNVTNVLVQEITLATLYRVPTGEGKMEKLGNLWSGKKYYFYKVMENDLGSCRLQISNFFCICKY